MSVCPPYCELSYFVVNFRKSNAAKVSRRQLRLSLSRGEEPRCNLVADPFDERMYDTARISLRNRGKRIA